MLSLLLLAALVVVAPAWAGSGRAFPVASENYVIELFQGINPNIDWDPTNFLVDLSGQYANCKQLGKNGQQDVDRETPEGVTIGAVVDSTSGSGADVVSVNSYIQRVLDDWVRTGAYNAQIKRADRFGCSVRPACKGSAVIACLFSPQNAGGGNIIQNPTEAPQYALAFTHDQYGLAESMTGNKWDRSHLLENLSGFETQCAMIETRQGDWAFHKAREAAEARGMTVIGLFGYSRNRGSTEEGMVDILRGFKEIRTASRVGCSVIPDCMYYRGDIPDMYVVISCLYEE